MFESFRTTDVGLDVEVDVVEVVDVVDAETVSLLSGIMVVWDDRSNSVFLSKNVNKYLVLNWKYYSKFHVQYFCFA